MLYEKEDIGEKIYLIGAFNDLFIVTMKFPTRENTIKEYEQWKKECVKNAICLTNSYFPQIFQHSDINEFISLIKIKEEVCNENNIKIDDIVIPFIGGIKGEDFRKLLNILYKEKNDFWIMKNAIKKYYEELILNK
jgi:hypothetical protein